MGFVLIILRRELYHAIPCLSDVELFPKYFVVLRCGCGFNTGRYKQVVWVSCAIHCPCWYTVKVRPKLVSAEYSA